MISESRTFINYTEDPKSKAHRDKVNAKVMKDPVMNDPKHKDKAMPFEMNMAYGDFASIVNLES